MYLHIYANINRNWGLGLLGVVASLAPRKLQVGSNPTGSTDEAKEWNTT